METLVITMVNGQEFVDDTLSFAVIEQAMINSTALRIEDSIGRKIMINARQIVTVSEFTN